MDTIPPELIYSIVHEISDTETLKACALVASAFREPSQRILLRSVILGGDNPCHSYRTVWTILQISAHIASYVRTLLFNLPTKDSASGQTCSLPELLGKFTNVSQLVISGATQQSKWDDLIPGAADAVFTFIRKPTLEGFHVMDIQELPIDLLALVLSSVTTTSFLSGSVNRQASPLLTSGHPIPSIMENLVFLDDFEGLGNIFAGAAFAPCMANLRKLWVRPGPGYTSNIVASAADNLEEICFDCTDMDATEFDASPLVDRFPSLRFFSIRLDFDDRDRPWVVQTLCSILSSDAQDIAITYDCDNIFEPRELHTLSSSTMDALNNALRGRPVCPRLSWRLQFFDADDEDADPDAAGFVMDFTAGVEQGIPIAHERGMLVVEKISGPEQILTWPGGTTILVL
ncbi:hypothetical protein B0H11DRAFT_591053 [Mycena galericulata]|nr:hypothetical protein B0H11DRAFT_591053 [Mycena galericulata]